MVIWSPKMSRSGAEGEGLGTLGEDMLEVERQEPNTIGSTSCSVLLTGQLSEVFVGTRVDA